MDQLSQIKIFNQLLSIHFFDISELVRFLFVVHEHPQMWEGLEMALPSTSNLNRVKILNDDKKMRKMRKNDRIKKTKV